MHQLHGLDVGTAVASNEEGVGAASGGGWWGDVVGKRGEAASSRGRRGDVALLAVFPPKKPTTKSNTPKETRNATQRNNSSKAWAQGIAAQNITKIQGPPIPRRKNSLQPQLCMYHQSREEIDGEMNQNFHNFTEFEGGTRADVTIEPLMPLLAP